jgi:hypothetical protein
LCTHPTRTGWWYIALQGVEGLPCQSTGGEPPAAQPSRSHRWYSTHTVCPSCGPNNSRPPNSNERG